MIRKFYTTPAILICLAILMQCSKKLTINIEGSKEFKRSWTNALIADSLGHFEEAIDGYTKIINADYYERSTVNALNNRGRAKVVLGDTLGGLKDLRRSLSILPTSSALISISALQSNPDSSIAYSMRARELAPDEPKVYYGIVGYYTLIAPNKDSALYYADYLLKLKPNARMLDLLMTTYLIFPHPDHLIEVTDKLILDAPKDAYAYNNRGFAFFMKGEYDQAKRDICTSLSLDANNSYAYRNLGLVFLQTQKLDSACVQFKKAEESGFSSKYGDEVESLLRIHCTQK